jgi:hypothetical protein
MNQIECQTCGWEGYDSQLVAQFSDQEPGCPSCSGSDLLDLEAPEESECGHYPEAPNGPTGHGDICHSDADPGL